MSVLIKSMEMPETCDDCPFHVYHSHYEYVCKATPLFYPMNLANSKGIRKDWCPLVEAQPSPIWHETYDDDPESFPDDDRTVLVSFDNFSQPMLGQWRHDPDIGGAWYIGDTDETFIENDLFVDGWWELPRKPEGRT